MKSLHYLPLAFIILAGCTHTPKAPEPRIITQRVEVPIRVPCKPERGPEPSYAADAVPLDADIFELSRALLVDRKQRQARQAELDGALNACM